MGILFFCTIPRRVVPISLFILIFLTSCDLIQPPESIPSYIRVQSYILKDSVLLSEGTTSSKITAVSVDDNSDYRGMYQIPSSIPILATGQTKISLQAVVQEDGISANLLPYPFYTTYTTNANLQPGVLDTIRPVFYYNSGITKFAWPQGDFETGNVLKTISPNSANMFLTDGKDTVFEGHESCEVDMSTGHDTFDAVSTTLFASPASGVAWLEMNYKTDVPMDVGIYPINPSVSIPASPEFISGVNATTTWKKVYINIGPELQYFSQDPNFNIYFFATASGNAHIFIDNLKLLYLD